MRFIECNFMNLSQRQRRRLNNRKTFHIIKIQNDWGFYMAFSKSETSVDKFSLDDFPPFSAHDLEMAFSLKKISGIKEISLSIYRFCVRL